MMISTVTKKVFTYIQTINRALNFNAKRSFYTVLIVLGVIPFLFMAYIGLIANFNSKSIMYVLQTNPRLTVLLIIALLDLLSTYVMWMIRDSIVANRRQLRFVMLTVIFQQLLVANFMVTGFALMAIVMSRELPTSNNKSAKQFWIISSMATIMYMFCLLMAIKVM
ncbi:hypothetical protein [Loigolactobacillus coryniformis]|uniref:hypothetical protein n=1 Tax=Loigolactobacillus coryniformis TaxID=1610 RepID=UPI00055763CD|nr:hypothetical protein [Loigolactobacillus coryniformis]